MSAKLVQVSDDNGVTWYTLPGGTGDFNDELTPVADTVFGQSFESNEMALLSWVVTANGLYKGFAGYVATISEAKTPLTLTDEAMSLESGQIYKVTDPTRNLWDRSTPITVEDNSSDVTAEVEWVDYLWGRIKFVDTYTVLGSVTVSGSYFSVKDQVGKANSFTLTQTANAVESSDFETVQNNGGVRTFIPGLRTVTLDLSGFFDQTSTLRDQLLQRNEVIIEVNPDGGGLSSARGFFKLATRGQSGDVGDIETEEFSFTLNVPFPTGTELPIYTPFSWVHDPTTTLAPAIIKMIEAWEQEALIDVQYLEDGVNGYKGKAVLTDISLTGGLEAMNEFAGNFQGTDATTDVP